MDKNVASCICVEHSEDGKEVGEDMDITANMLV